MSKTSVYLCICVFMYLASKFIFLPPWHVCIHVTSHNAKYIFYNES
jgi:hypothetical protein